MIHASPRKMPPFLSSSPKNSKPKIARAVSCKIQHNHNLFNNCEVNNSQNRRRRTSIVTSIVQNQANHPDLVQPTFLSRQPSVFQREKFIKVYRKIKCVNSINSRAPALRNIPRAPRVGLFGPQIWSDFG